MTHAHWFYLYVVGPTLWSWFNLFARWADGFFFKNATKWKCTTHFALTICFWASMVSVYVLPSWSIASLAPAMVLAYPAAQAFELTWYTNSWSGSTFMKTQKTKHIILKCTTVQQCTKKAHLVICVRLCLVVMNYWLHGRCKENESFMIPKKYRIE